MKLFLGLCDGSSFDAHYGMTTEYSKGTEIYFFRGFENSILQYNNDKSEWKLSLYSKPSIYAIFNGTATYPFGVQKWFVYNDTCKYESEDELESTQTKKNHKLSFNFNACHPNEEFNCADGTW